MASTVILEQQDLQAGDVVSDEFDLNDPEGNALFTVNLTEEERESTTIQFRGGIEVYDTEMEPDDWFEVGSNNYHGPFRDIKHGGVYRDPPWYIDMTAYAGKRCRFTLQLPDETIIGVTVDH